MDALMLSVVGFFAVVTPMSFTLVFFVSQVKRMFPRG